MKISKVSKKCAKGIVACLIAYVPYAAALLPDWSIVPLTGIILAIENALKHRNDK